jgi:hypothetical protein
MYQKYPADSLPIMYELPSEDPEEMGLPGAEGVSLKETCRLGVEDFFMGSDLNLYYDVEHTGWYKHFGARRRR